MIPAGQGPGKSSETPKPPAWVCRPGPGCSPSCAILGILGTGTLAERVALSPAALQEGCSPRAQQQRRSAPFPAHSGGGRGAAEDRSHCKGCRHRSTQPYSRLVILYLALSSNNNSGVSGICKTFGLSQLVLVISQPSSRVDCQLTWWQNNQLHQLGSPTGCNQAQINIL